MELGILFDQTQNFIGGTKYLGDYVPAEVNVSPEVQRAFQLAQPVWSATSKIPLVSLDEGNHGVDRGIVMRQGILNHYDKNDIKFDRSELVARISFGAANYDEARKKSIDANALDFSKTGRIHLSLHASRQYFPKNWKQVPVDKFRKTIIERKTTPILEEIHVSLRWKDGKYDDWSKIDDWVKDAGNYSLSRKRFNQNRTIYCCATRGRISSEHSSEADPQKVLKFIKREGRKNQIIPMSPSTTPYGKYHKNANEAVEEVLGKGIFGALPIIGYDNVSRVIQNLPRTCDLSTLNPMDGAEFLFTLVMPVLKAYLEK